MSIAKPFAIAAVIAFLAFALTAAPASAQGGGPSPTGGTSAQPTVYYQDPAPNPVPTLGETSIGSSLRGWFMNLRVSRQAAYFRMSINQGRTQLVTIQRRLWER